MAEPSTVNIDSIFIVQRVEQYLKKVWVAENFLAAHSPQLVCELG